MLLLLLAAKVLVVDESAALRYLGREVGEVAGEEEEVARVHAEGEPHEDGGVEGERYSHLAADHLRRLAGQVGKGRYGNAPVGNGAPEVRAHEVLSEFWSFQLVHTISD